jgi:hypothetical protein
MGFTWEAVAMKNARIGLAVALALCLGGTEVRAQNLIVNGGFEINGGAGSPPTSWTISGGGNICEQAGFAGLSPHSGTWFLAMGNVGGDASISQAVTTTAGMTYDLQFFYSSAGGNPNDLNVLWNGSTVYSEVNTPAQGYVQHDVFVIATGSDTVTFAGRNDPSWNGLDDVSLTLAAVPEPATWAMLAITGIGAVGFTAVRRRVRSRLADKKQ